MCRDGRQVISIKVLIAQQLEKQSKLIHEMPEVLKEFITLPSSRNFQTLEGKNIMDLD
jgi:hypothetical protein